jgi:hypothetical protein
MVTVFDPGLIKVIDYMLKNGDFLGKLQGMQHVT